MLTKKQYDLLLFIDKRLKAEGVPPSFDEMRDFLGLKSKSGVHRLISSLEERRFISRLPHKARAIDVVRLPDNMADCTPKNHGIIENKKPKIITDDTLIPLYGKIAAGTPIEAIRDDNRFVNVPSNMIGLGEHYALTIEGDSMINEGILDGDTVVIQRTNTAENGAIVVALVDGYEVTLKKLFCRNGNIELEPANPHYKTQIFEADRVSVQGRLVGLMRNY